MGGFNNAVRFEAIFNRIFLILGEKNEENKFDVYAWACYAHEYVM